MQTRLPTSFSFAFASAKARLRQRFAHIFYQCKDTIAAIIWGGHIMPTAGYANDYAQCKQDRAPTVPCVGR